MLGAADEVSATSDELPVASAELPVILNELPAISAKIAPPMIQHAPAILRGPSRSPKRIAEKITAERGSRYPKTAMRCTGILVSCGK